jgi:hypothetical protein
VRKEALPCNLHSPLLLPLAGVEADRGSEGRLRRWLRSESQGLRHRGPSIPYFAASVLRNDGSVIIFVLVLLVVVVLEGPIILVRPAVVYRQCCRGKRARAQMSLLSKSCRCIFLLHLLMLLLVLGPSEALGEALATEAVRLRARGCGRAIRPRHLPHAAALRG